MEARRPQPTEPWAQRMQPTSDYHDFALTNDARNGARPIVWWWGKRRMDGKAGAYCYLCDEWITHWDVRWPMTESAKQVVMEHRRGHIKQLEER